MTRNVSQSKRFTGKSNYEDTNSDPDIDGSQNHRKVAEQRPRAKKCCKGYKQRIAG